MNIFHDCFSNKSSSQRTIPRHSLSSCFMISDGTFEDIKEEDRESDYVSLSDLDSDSDSDLEMEAPPQEDLPESPVYNQYL